MVLLTWFSLSLLMSMEAVVQAEVTCTEKAVDQHSLLQTTIRGTASAAQFDDYEQNQLYGQESAVTQAEQSIRTLATTADEVQAARTSTDSAIAFESQAADFLNLAYKEVQQAEEIQEARVYEEANVTQILHDAVQELQRAPQGQGREDIGLLQALHRAEIAQAAMIKDASQEDQALAGLRSAMASAAQAATSAKLVDETQTSRTLDNAVVKIQDSVRLTKDIPKKLGLAEAHSKDLETQMVLAKKELATVSKKAKADSDAAYQAPLMEMQKLKEANKNAMTAIQKERAAAAADLHKAEVARKEASAMYQAASSTQLALETQASKTAESLMKVSAEASQAAQFLQGALGQSDKEPIR